MDQKFKYAANNINDVIRNNKEAGWFFFHPETIKFFHSCVSSVLFENKTFVTSELHLRGDNWVRLYTVRKYNPETAWIDTIGKYGVFTSRKEALKFAENYELEKEDVK